MTLPKIPIITKLIQRHQRKRIRTIWHGYRLIKKNNQLDLLLRLKHVLTKTNLKTNVKLTTSANKSIDVELVTRQYLTIRIIDRHLRFNKAVLYSIGANKYLRYPLPHLWQKALIKHNIQVNRFICSIYWFFYVVFLWCYGVLIAIKSIKNITNKTKNIGDYVYFDQIRSNCFSHNKAAHNITNWYLQWENKAKNITTLCHGFQQEKPIKRDDININYCDVMPNLSGVNRFKYILLVFKYILLSLFFLLLGRTTQAILLNQNIKFLLIKLVDKEHLAQDYLFHNSNLFYRPLWTYEAEAKGSRVIFYFYSTNDKSFKTKAGEAIQHPWHLLSWGYYLVWYEAQLTYLNYSPKIEEMGVIWFSDNHTQLSQLPNNSIAVFDIQPVYRTFYITLGASLEYYIPSTASQFLLDIQQVLLENNNNIAHKRKRISGYVHANYKHNIKQLKLKSNYIAIHPDLAAITLVQQTKATISMPFTSTALIAKAEGKPSVYYDPFGLVQKDDRAAHGIPILVGIDELRNWVQSLDG